MLLDDGYVKCWGLNNYSQLGNGSTTNSLTPVFVSGLTNATEISLGQEHSCALLTDKTVKCWGNNIAGLLGDGTYNVRSTPVLVSGLTNVTQISVSSTHSCALLTAGTAKCWGVNSNGQLGDGTTTTSITPVYVRDTNGDPLANISQISLGWNHSCARLSNGTVKCWGYNVSGQLGNNSTTQSLTPVLASGLSSTTQIDLGNQFSCALDAGYVYCWGNNWDGQLGDRTIHNTRLIPTAVHD